MEQEEKLKMIEQDLNLFFSKPFQGIGIEDLFVLRQRVGDLVEIARTR